MYPYFGCRDLELSMSLFQETPIVGFFKPGGVVPRCGDPRDTWGSYKITYRSPYGRFPKLGGSHFRGVDNKDYRILGGLY